MSYIIVSSQASDEERKLLDRINRNGGTDRFLMGVRCRGVALAATLGMLVVAWTPLLAIISMVATLLAGLWYFRGRNTYKIVVARPWPSTDNQALIALDKVWRAIAEQEAEESWRHAIDQQRFVRVRQLAGMSEVSARPLIEAERARLDKPNNTD